MFSAKIAWSPVLVSAGLWCLLSASGWADGAVAAPRPATPSQRSLLEQMQDAFTGIAKSAEPFVVNITAAHSLTLNADPDAAPDAAPDQPSPGDPPAAGGSSSPSPAPAFPKQEESTGSGLIVRSDGYILTNDHVVEGSRYVTVKLSDGRDFRGKVTPDFRSDLALVKIDAGADPLPVARFADSDEVQPGQWAIAIGSPFDLQNTMTVGVISAVHRQQDIGDDRDERYYPDLMQTDAAINPGNSGGPLLNIDGNVVGVNVAIESPVEGSSGVGFAIPAKTAQYVIDQLISNGKVVRGFLGLAPSDLTPLHEQRSGVKSGAWVKQVDKDSPAGRAGIRATDIITSFDNKPVDGEMSLRDAISDAAPGTTVPMQLVRDSKTVTVSVTIATPPPLEADNPPPNPSAPKVGLTFRELTASDRQKMHFAPDVSGVFVTAVAPNSPADDAGFEANDVIESIDGRASTSATQVGAILGALQPGDTKTFVIVRSDDGAIEEVTFDLSM